jgi:hypothetical protein
MSLIDEIEKAKEKQALKEKFYQALEAFENEKASNIRRKPKIQEFTSLISIAIYSGK